MSSDPTQSTLDKIKEFARKFHESSYGKVVEAGTVSGFVFFTLNKIFRGDKR